MQLDNGTLSSTVYDGSAGLTVSAGPGWAGAEEGRSPSRLTAMWVQGTQPFDRDVGAGHPDV